MSVPKIEEIRLDDEFRAINRELTDDERARSRQSIKQDGVRDAISVWAENGSWLLVDGYNRYDTWHGEGGDPPAVNPVPARLKTRDEVKRWIREVQLARRNVDANDRAYLLGKQFSEEKADPLDNLKKGPKSPKSPRVTSGKMREKRALKAGVSKKTVSMAVKFAKAVDAIELSLGKKAAGDIKAGVVSQKDAIAIAALPSDEMGKALARAKLGKPIQDAPKAPNLKDDVGNEVPENLRSVFALVPLFDTIINQYVPGIQTNMRRIAESINEYRATSADAVAKNLHTIFSSFRPAWVCRDCEGKGCSKCKERGWRPKPCR